MDNTNNDLSEFYFDLLFYCIFLGISVGVGVWLYNFDFVEWAIRYAFGGNVDIDLQNPRDFETILQEFKDKEELRRYLWNRRQGGGGSN